MLNICYYCHAQNFGKPLYYYKVTDPWADIIGGDIPVFAIYESGHILFTKQVNHEQIIYHVLLDSAEKNKSLTALRGEAKKYLHYIPNNIELSGWTDQPGNIFYFNMDTLKVVHVYGSLRDTSQYDKPIKEYGFGLKLLLTLSESAFLYTHKNAKEWLPDNIEVLLWSYSHSTSNGIAWPKNWPGLADKKTVKRGDDLYSIYVPKNDFLKLQQYLKQVADKGGNTVRLNNKKWSISYRLPFPGIK